MNTGYIIIGVSRMLIGILAGLALTGADIGFSLPNFNMLTAAVTSEAICGLLNTVFFEQTLSLLLERPISDIVGLSTTFLGVNVVLAVGAVAFALTTVYATPSTESEPELTEQPSQLREYTGQLTDGRAETTQLHCKPR